MRVIEMYDLVKHRAEKSGDCEVCKERVTRKRTFTQSINPYNRNKDGQPKTKYEILEEL